MGVVAMRCANSTSRRSRCRLSAVSSEYRRRDESLVKAALGKMAEVIRPTANFAAR
jgi:hypothetical protein